MTTQEILNSGFNKTQKGYKLYALGHTRQEVSEWITGGNYGFAHNIWKKWSESNTIEILNLPFEYNFNRSFGIELEIYGATREDLIREITRAGIEIEARTKEMAITKIKSATSISNLRTSVFNGGRYFKLNVQSFERHGTVEFRQHSGTTQFSKIKNWILICGRLVEYAKQNGVTNNFNHFLNESLQDYVSDRAVDLVA